MRRVWQTSAVPVAGRALSPACGGELERGLADSYTDGTFPKRGTGRGMRHGAWRPRHDQSRRPQQIVRRAQRTGGRRRRHRLRGRPWRDRHAARPVRLRQDHDAALRRRSRTAGQRADHDRRSDHARCRRRRVRAAEPAQPRHGVPVLRDLAAHDRARKCRLCARRPRHAQGRAQEARDGGARDGAAGAARRPAGAAALRRPAAARRDRARDGRTAAGAAVRRAAEQSRCAAARRDAQRAAPYPAPDRAVSRSTSPTTRPRRSRCRTGSW